MKNISQQICVDRDCNLERLISTQEKFHQHYSQGHEILLEATFIQIIGELKQQRQSNYISYSQQRLELLFYDYERLYKNGIKKFIDSILGLLGRDIICTSVEELNSMSIQEQILSQQQLNILIDLLNGNNNEVELQTKNIDLIISKIEVTLQQLNQELQSMFKNYLDSFIHLQQNINQPSDVKNVGNQSQLCQKYCNFDLCSQQDSSHVYFNDYNDLPDYLDYYKDEKIRQQQYEESQQYQKQYEEQQEEEEQEEQREILRTQEEAFCESYNNQNNQPQIHETNQQLLFVGNDEQLRQSLDKNLEQKDNSSQQSNNQNFDYFTQLNSSLKNQLQQIPQIPLPKINLIQATKKSKVQPECQYVPKTTNQQSNYSPKLIQQQVCIKNESNVIINRQLSDQNLCIAKNTIKSLELLLKLILTTNKNVPDTQRLLYFKIKLLNQEQKMRMGMINLSKSNKKSCQQYLLKENGQFFKGDNVVTQYSLNLLKYKTFELGISKIGKIQFIGDEKILVVIIIISQAYPISNYQKKVDDYQFIIYIKNIELTIL